MSKTDMPRVGGENTQLWHYLARLHRKALCYFKSVEMLKHSLHLLCHYLKFLDIPVPPKAPLILACFILEFSNAPERVVHYSVENFVDV